MADLLAPLYRLPSRPDDSSEPRIRIAMAYERSLVIDFVRENWNERWASETSIAFDSHPLRCFVAIADGRLCGFACYDATFRGFFGPMGVSKEKKGQGIGRLLLLQALWAMRDSGYVYAIIGDVAEAQQFYEKTIDVTVIENSQPGGYAYDLAVPHNPTSHDHER